MERRKERGRKKKGLNEESKGRKKIEGGKR